MTEQDKKRIGKFLSLVLRHDPAKIELELDENGWANVKEPIPRNGLVVSGGLATLEGIVRASNKQQGSF